VGGRMDPVTLIVAALAAGASGGAISALQDDVQGAVIAAYGKLRGLVAKRVAGNPGAELALTEYEADPEHWETPLTAKLTQLGAADDTDLVAAANALMKLVDGVGARAGKYNVKVANSTGVQVGDGNVQFNNFGA
jgi:RIP homotypic interaction motif